ncbi:MAG: ABC transporter permease, partial [Bacteroidetes bacterium]|nr:ABC transporter permease [Bacteroidota bacterium]
LDLKIAIRTFLKGKWYNLLNITGLSLGLAAFIFVSLYVDHETSYDQWNKNIERVFLVETEMPNGPSPYTPGLLATTIKNQCPEIEEVGRMNTALFQIPFHTSSGRFMIKKWVGADYSIANILGIRPQGFKLDSTSETPTILLSKETAKALFPDDQSVDNKTVNMMSKSGMPLSIGGVIGDVPGNTNFNFDCIGFSKDITLGKDQSYASRIYQTFILVKPHTDMNRLSKKIDEIYKEAALTDSSLVAKAVLSHSEKSVIYLDPLKNLHLKPHYGSDVNKQIVNSLIVLAIIILIVTGFNFTNLYISQATKRSKEVGIKKVNGIVRSRIVLQFMFEIFIQCLLALLVSFVFVIIGLPYFNQLLQVDLLISGINSAIITQLFLALIVVTLTASLYPSLMMAGFKPIEVLRGNVLINVGKGAWVRNTITVLQFTFTIVFIISLMVIYQQVKFMKTESPGFSPQQVIYVDNLSLFNHPRKFKSVRERIKAIPGVKYVTVTSNVPGGILPAAHEYEVQHKDYALNTVSVDYEYFKTLNIKLAKGRVFSSYFFGDSLNAIINETAAKAMGLKSPIGETIKSKEINYSVIGVIKDVKSDGFEVNVKPTIYVMSDSYGLAKTQIMISAENNSIPAMLKILNSEWSSINRLDGDNFNYHFLDELYGKLFVKQEQLQTVLFSFSLLALFIASLGFFSLAAHAIRLRMKEIAIRKVFGAGKNQLMVVLSKPFFYIVLIANLLAWPVAFIIVNKWLETFAFRVQISIMPFIIALMVSFAIVIFTVCLQMMSAVRFNPALKLKV